MPTKIQWCDESWNPVIGCTKCSPGCLNCYAERMACRQVGMERKRNQKQRYYTGTVDKKGWTGLISLKEKALDKPLHWRKSRRIFVCSMSDLFHPKVPFEFIDKVFQMIALCWGNQTYRRNSYPNHTFLILTKRVKRMAEYMSGDVKKRWGDGAPCVGVLQNVHLGVSISNPDELWKVDELKKIPAAVRFLSLEPMLAEIKFTYDRLFCDRDPEEDSPVACVPCRCGKHWENAPIRGTTLNCIDWVVCGGESGPGVRPMHPDWPRNLRDQCVAAGVAFYFKQHGEYLHESQGADTDGPINAGGNSKKGYRWPDGTWSIRVTKKKAGCILDGKEWKQYPK